MDVVIEGRTRQENREMLPHGDSGTGSLAQSQPREALCYTLFPSAHKAGLICNHNWGWYRNNNNKNSYGKKIGRHKHPCELEFSWHEE